MPALILPLTFLLAAAAVIALRRAQPAEPPYGRRMAWIALLLVLQAAVFYGFVYLHARTNWGIAAANPPGLAFLTQTLRAVLLLAGLSSWFGLVKDDLSSIHRRLITAAAVVAFGWGSGSLLAMAMIALGFLFMRMQWIHQVTGWRRALTCVGAAILLLVVSIRPFITITDGESDMMFAIASRTWPPPLLLGTLAPSAATELGLIRVLDRGVQALVDLFRVQLLVVTFRMLFLPVRLSGLSLKRRFTINFFLVRSIPAFMSALVIFGLLYVGLGYLRVSQVRAAFDRTLARAGTLAAGLADDPRIRNADTPPSEQLAAAAAWLGADGARAHVVIRDNTGVRAVTPGTPASIVSGDFAGADSVTLAAFRNPDSTLVSGLLPAGDALYLVARRLVRPGRAIEVFVPLDSSYLAGVMRSIGGDLAMRALPHVFVGGQGMRIDGDTSWVSREIVMRIADPASKRHARRWFLARSYLPAGDWQHAAQVAQRGAVELQIDTTVGGFVRNSIRSLSGVYANLYTLGIVLGLLIIISMVESFAVRSGRSIAQAVLDEVTTLRTAAERIGAGDLDYRLPVKGKDEFAVVAASFNQMAANLKEQREELIAAERIEEDLAVAREIQQRFLPQSLPGLAGLDVAGVSIPSREVGGDLFYWFTHEDGSLGFTLGDVSGKSVPAALLMSNVLAGLRAQALMRVELSQSLGRVNQLIFDQIEPGRFVTLFYGETDPRRGELRYTSAGHNPPLLLRANGTIEWLRDGGVPLGVLAKATYTTSTVRFDPGDTLVVYSDGVTEAQGPADAASPGAPGMFGEDRLAAVVAAQHGHPARGLLDAVLGAVETFARGTPQADDITIVVVRRA